MWHQDSSSKIFRNGSTCHFTSADYGKRFQRLEVFPVGEKGGCGGGGTDLQILGFQMGVEEVQKTL